MYKCFLSAWVTGWTVLAYCDIGKPIAAGVYSPTLPIVMFAFLAITAFLGFAAGAE